MAAAESAASSAVAEGSRAAKGDSGAVVGVRTPVVERKLVGGLAGARSNVVSGAREGRTAQA